MKTTIVKTIAAVGAGAALVAGAAAVSGADSSKTTSGDAAGMRGGPGEAPPQSGGAGPHSGGAPQGSGPPGAPGLGTEVTGAAAERVAAVARAAHKGTVERVVKLQDGSYVVHVITSGGELHVAVSKALKVTGAARGGPGAGGPPAGMPGQDPPQGSAPQGAAPQGAAPRTSGSASGLSPS